MDRREFFRQGAGKLSGAALEEMESRVAARAKRWIRPPFALPELDFLLACTRCQLCIDACPFHVIFPLSPRLGIQVAGTPALDLLHKGCHMCADWPCVRVCEPAALVLPEPDGPEEQSGLPKLARAVINSSACLPFQGPECGACAGSCPVPETLTWKGARPVINQQTCTGCAMCRETCIVEDKAINIQSLEVIQASAEHL